MNSIPRFRIPSFTSQKENVDKAIENNDLVYGTAISDFGHQIKKLFGKNYICLCNSGNSALVLSIKALGLKNKKILIPAIGTCFAIENAVIFTNNFPVYCDVNIEDGNLNTLAAFDTFQKQEYHAIISPNYFGNISNISELKKIGVPVIEDCSQSFLSNITINTNADIQVLSFYPTKVINAIDGGAILTNNKSLIEKTEDLVYYGHQEVVDNIPRMNLKMNNINAAFGLGTCKQIKKINDFYIQIVKEYIDVANSFPTIHYLQNHFNNILYKFVLKFETFECKERFNVEMQKNNIAVSNEFISVCNNISNFKISKELLSTTTSIPFYFTLSYDEISYIKINLNHSLKKAINQ